MWLESRLDRTDRSFCSVEITPLHGTSPEEIFGTFRNHLNDLLHHTITEAPLVQLITADRASLEFRQGGDSVAVKVGRGYYLFLSQTLEAKKIKAKEYRLRTLAYAYRIGFGPRREDEWFVRWEYNSREHIDALHPRHHCHLAAAAHCGGKEFSLEKLHIASGWVTIEEVIRFLIYELKVRPKSADWDARLQASEELFRKWTARSL